MACLWSLRDGLLRVEGWRALARGTPGKDDVTRIVSRKSVLLLDC